MITKPENPPTMTLRRRLKRGRRWLVAMLARGFISGVSLLPFGFTRFALPRLLRTFAFLLRKQAMTQLELAYGDAMEPRERRRVSNRVAWNLGLFLAELLASWRGKIPADYVEAGDTRERVRELLDEGQGPDWASPATSATGSCSARSSASSAGEQAGPAIAKRHPNPWLNDFIVESRARIGWEIVFQDAGLRPLLRALKSGKMLGTVPDQDIRRAAGIFVPFFGRDAYTSTGPASLSVFSGAPILLGFLRRRPGGPRARSLRAHPPRHGRARPRSRDRAAHPRLERCRRNADPQATRRLDVVPRALENHARAPSRPQGRPTERRTLTTQPCSLRLQLAAFALGFGLWA
jgi:lauroyl/myristoyl acyltransferase